MEKINFKIIKNFGPSVFKIKIPNKILDALNNYIDEIVNDQNKSKDLDIGKNLVGDVTQEFKLDKDFIKKSDWGSFLGKSVRAWIDYETKKKITKFAIIETWVVRQFENEYNPTHWHNGHVSGAGFLKVPKNLGKHVQKKDSQQYRGGQLQLIHGSRMFLSHSTYNITPEVGDLYLFPHYMMHSVFPFKNSNEERRSISFNAVIDPEIYDVYGKH